MKKTGVEKSGTEPFMNARRRPVSLSQTGLVRVGGLRAEGHLPLIIEPTCEGVSLVDWATGSRDFIETHLSQVGGIVFRNFALGTAEQFESFMRAVSGDLLHYEYASTPRSTVSGNIYTSTEYPAEQTIPLHNEMSYARSWPMKIGFWCLKPAARGGETPVADGRRVFRRLNPRLRERFSRKKILYVRNYGYGLDLSWQKAFRTTSKTAVERYCRSAGLHWEWKSDDGLRTRQFCQASARHPKTGEMIWFNQAHLFHVTSLEPAVREALLSQLDSEDLPRNAYYGDGTPIEDSALDEIREVYQQERVIFPWQAGDILLLDNMLTAHGRLPFGGPRTVLVGMGAS